jgi:SRSO17 transposase
MGLWNGPNINRLSDIKRGDLKIMNSPPIWIPEILKAVGLDDYNVEDFSKDFIEYLDTYAQFFFRKGQSKYFVATVKGLLSDLDRKSMEPIAHNFLGDEKMVRNLCNFMTKSKFDDHGILMKHQEVAGSFLSHEDAMITGDGCDFPKKGHASVGVWRQYCGRSGKIDNCQASIMVGLASIFGSAILDYELHMPEIWFSAKFAKLRKKCGVPEGLKFKTKNQQLLDKIWEVYNSGFVKAKYVGVDSAFGRDHAFLDGLPEGLIYFADVPVNHLVYFVHPDSVDSGNVGKGKKSGPVVDASPLSVAEIARKRSVSWEKVVLGNGGKGPIVTQDKCIRVVEHRDGVPGKMIWLYVRKLEDNSIKYALCNESMEATPSDIRKPALMRWTIELDFKECKKYLGMDHYEARSWTAWRRHILFTIIAHVFITLLRHKFSYGGDFDYIAPQLKNPMTLKEYLKALIEMKTGKQITNPSATLKPELPQKILTIGLLRDFIQKFLVNKDNTLEIIGQRLEKSAIAYESSCKKKSWRFLKKEFNLTVDDLKKFSSKKILLSSVN